MQRQWRVIEMLYVAGVLLIIAILAAILGFGVIAGTAAWIAKILFIVFLIMLVGVVIFELWGRRST
jgi:uncharacterized membrane protein YtjA (UPF0391 family)